MWKLPGGIEIRRLENAGAATGILAKHPKELKHGSGGILAFLRLSAAGGEPEKQVTARGTGLALLLGGGLCNFMDRVKKGTVTDYIRFTKCPVAGIRKLVFNVSDFCIIIGGLLLCTGRKFRIKS